LLEARLFGSLPLARAAGQEASRGELMRYLAELTWAPHVMQHNPHLSWRAIDASTIELSAASAGGPARVRLIFEDGDIARIEADDRPRMAGRRIVPTRWEGCCGDYREVEGLPHTDPGGGELVVGQRPFRILAREGNRV
jgi:hypothetical protein